VISSVAGGAVSRVDPDSTGVNPSWRSALSHITVGMSWDEGSTADFISQQIDQLKQSTLTLDQLTTDSGSYLNEVKKKQKKMHVNKANPQFHCSFSAQGSLHELDFKKSFFGVHYDKLKWIKNEYDPTSLFVVASGVGSEEWDEQLVCRRSRLNID